MLVNNYSNNHHFITRAQWCLWTTIIIIIIMILWAGPKWCWWCEHWRGRFPACLWGSCHPAHHQLGINHDDDDDDNDTEEEKGIFEKWWMWPRPPLTWYSSWSSSARGAQTFHDENAGVANTTSRPERHDASPNRGISTSLPLPQVAWVPPTFQGKSEGILFPYFIPSPSHWFPAPPSDLQH